MLTGKKLALRTGKSSYPNPTVARHKIQASINRSRKDEACIQHWTSNILSLVSIIDLITSSGLLDKGRTPISKFRDPDVRYINFYFQGSVRNEAGKALIVAREFADRLWSPANNLIG